MRILLFKVLHLDPLFSETPTYGVYGLGFIRTPQVPVKGPRAPIFFLIKR